MVQVDERADKKPSSMLIDLVNYVNAHNAVEFLVVTSCGEAFVRLAGATHAAHAGQLQIDRLLFALKDCCEALGRII